MKAVSGDTSPRRYSLAESTSLRFVAHLVLVAAANAAPVDESTYRFRGEAVGSISRLPLPVHEKLQVLDEAQELGLGLNSVDTAKRLLTLRHDLQNAENRREPTDALKKRNLPPSRAAVIIAVTRARKREAQQQAIRRLRYSPLMVSTIASRAQQQTALWVPPQRRV